MTKNTSSGNVPQNEINYERKGTMNRWFTSDTHFGHANIIKYCNRPFADVDEMNEALVENWNRVVHEDDTVYHLGDVALGPWERWDAVLSRLNGYKILVVGNHEKIFPGENNERRIERFRPEYEKYFDEIHAHYPKFVLSNGQVVNLSHFPYEEDHMEKARFMDYRLPDDGTVIVHGHTHMETIMSRSKTGTIQVHVGMDAHNYTPVSEQQVIDFIRVAGDVT
jgi:calcineurin-like phosphoesterase family protein